MTKSRTISQNFAKRETLPVGVVMVGGWMIVELGLNNCNARASFSCEPGKGRTMLSPLKWLIWRVGGVVEGGVGMWLR